ncbi:MAG: dihydrodipicolinate synthase family protein [Bryobacteraceae bacterium]
MKLQGIHAEIPTPFDYKGEIYRAKLEHNLAKWNHAALAGYVVCTGAGEGDLLGFEEKIAVWELVAEHAAPGRVLIAGVGVPGVHESLQLIERAADLGYAAALLDSLPAAPETQKLYLCSIADRARIPVLATPTAPLPHPRLVDLRPQVARSAGGLWQALSAGASAAFLQFASAAPYAAISIWEAHRTREEEAGEELQGRIAHAAECVSSRYGVPGLKYAMDLNGYYGGPPRLPNASLPLQARQEIEEAFRDIKG